MKKLVLFVLCLCLVGCAKTETVSEEGLSVKVPESWEHEETTTPVLMPNEDGDLEESEYLSSSILCTPKDEEDVSVEFIYSVSYDNEQDSDEFLQWYAESMIAGVVDFDIEGTGEVLDVSGIRMGHVEATVSTGEYFHVFNFDLDEYTVTVYYIAHSQKQSELYYDQAMDIIKSVKKE